MAEPVSVKLMLDKSLWSRTSTYGYHYNLETANMSKNKFSIKPSQFLGIIYSWVIKDGVLYLMVYKSAIDYQNANYDFIPIIDNNLYIPQLKEAVDIVKKKKQMEADVAKKEAVGTVQFYVEKYGPWLLGAIVVVGVLPSIFKTLINPSRNEK
jgi:hypothetical protein